MAIREQPTRTRLLVATLGLASVSYLGCGEAQSPPGNLMAPPDQPEVPTSTVAVPEPPDPTQMPPGNLMAPPSATVATASPSASASTSASAVPSAAPVPTTKPKTPPLHHPPGNLMPPPPPPPKKP